MSVILDDNLQNEPEKPLPVFASRPLIIWGIVFLCGILFKIQHWPGGFLFLYISSAGMLAYTLNGMITYKGRNRFNLMIFIICMIIFLVLLIKRINEGPFDIWRDTIYFVILGIYFTAYEIQKRVAKWKFLISFFALLIVAGYITLLANFL